MVQTVAELDNPEHPGPIRRRSIVAIVLSVVVGMVLGYLGWVLPSPGGSLVVPTLNVLGVGLALAGCSWIVACFTPRRRGLWIFAVATGILSLLAAACVDVLVLVASGNVVGLGRRAASTERSPQTKSGTNQLERRADQSLLEDRNGQYRAARCSLSRIAISTKVLGKAFVEVSFTPVSLHMAASTTRTSAAARRSLTRATDTSLARGG